MEIRSGKELHMNEGIFDKILRWTSQTDVALWGPVLIALLLGAGIFLTIATRGLQFTHFWHSLKLVFSKEIRSEVGKGDISPFAALMTALAATVGNGNIAGVATAIAIGGPGAPVFMWIAAIFGMATKYAEGFLGVHYREIAPNGTMAGGPMYYLKNGLKNKKVGKFLGAAFAVCGSVACLIGTGNMAQSNSMTESASKTLNGFFNSGAAAEQTPPNYYFILIGAIIAILVGAVIIGGIKRIGHVSEKLVPAMIVAYIGCALFIILANISRIPEAYAIIFQSAFGIRPLIGASVGLAIQNGVSRGLLSNEAGLGSAAIAQGASTSEEPTKNGLIAMTGVFIDSLLVNTMTTLTIVLTGVYVKTQAWQGLGAEDNITGILVTQEAFNSVIPGIGGAIIAIASFVFGYTTLIGWSYYGEKCIEYLGGNKVIMPYRYTFIAFLFLGAILTPLAGEGGDYLNIVWHIGNIGNALMAAPNLVGLVFLTGVVARITRERLGKRI